MLMPVNNKEWFFYVRTISSPTRRCLKMRILTRGTRRLASLTTAQQRDEEVRNETRRNGKRFHWLDIRISFARDISTMPARIGIVCALVLLG